MAKKDTLFTVVGITTHSGKNDAGSTAVRTKIRYGTDIVRLIKMLGSAKKIYDKSIDMCLSPERIDFVDLPRPMLKDDALNHMLTMEQFQSPADQQLIKDTIDHRNPQPKRVRSANGTRVKRSKDDVSLDAIRARKKNLTVTDILTAAEINE